jgi:AcrR family transcriptional regulator
MEAATSRTPAGRLEGDKAQRIVDAMRRSVARRGVAGSTFDRVAREAGVSRGLLHYYFGTKENLLVEVVRRDADLRIEALERHLADARTAEDLIALLVAHLEDLVANDADLVSVTFELFTLSQRNPDVRAELSAMWRRSREHVAAVLAAKQEEGVLRLAAPPAAVAEILFSLADGLSLRMLVDQRRAFGETVAAGVACVRALLRG